MAKLNFKNAARNNKNLKYGGYMTIVMIFAVIAMIVVNLLFEQLRLKVDLTPEQLYTIGAKSKIILEDLDEDVTITGLYVTGRETTEAVTLIEDYIKNSKHISYKQVDPYTNPDFVAKYKEDTETIAANSLIVENNETGKFKIVSQNDLYEYQQTQSSDFYDTSYEITAFRAEEALTSAIQYVTNTNTPVLYTLTGHGESALASGMTSMLKKANFDLKEFNFMNSAQKLEANNYTVLLINNPMQDISDYELQDLENYLEAGGNLLLNLSVNYPEGLKNFTALLERYGVAVEHGSLVESDPNYYYYYSNLLIPELGDSDVLEGISANTVAVLTPIAIKQLPNRNAATEITELLTTSDHAIIKKNPESKDLDFEEGDEQGKFDLGLMINEAVSKDGKLYYTKFALFSSSYMFDSDVGYMTAGNYNLFLNTLNTLQTEVDTLYIDPKEYVSTDVVISAGQLVIWSAVFVIAIPLGVLIAGLVIWSRRKRL